MNKIKVDNKFESTLTLYYKKEGRTEQEKGLDRLKLNPGKNSFEMSDADLKQVRPKLEFYEKNNKITFQIIAEAVVVDEDTPAIGALTADNYADSEDKDALEVFGKELGIEIDKRKGVDKIKAFIAEAIAKAE